MRNKKKFALVLAVVILTLSMASTGFAKTATETLTAYYRNITIFRNGVQVNFQNEPFIVNDRTYLPVREISELLGKNVTFNPQTYRIDIADVADPNQVLLQTRVIQQEVTIKNQETRIKDLEAQLEAAKKTTSSGSKSKISNLSDLEDYLNDKYSPEDKIDFEIVLSGTKNNVVLEIYVEDSRSSDRYYEWKSKDKKDYAEDLVDEIIDEFDPKNISGFYRDNYDKKSKENFTVSSKGVVTMGSGSGSGGSDNSTLLDLEDSLNRFYGYEGDVDFDIIVGGTTRRIELSIDAINDDLDKLSNTKKIRYLEEIYKFIEEEMSFTSIEGRIFDKKVEYDFDYTPGGKATLTKR